MLSLMSSEAGLNKIFQRQNLDSLNYDLLEWRNNLFEWADFNVWDVIDKPMKPSIAALQYVCKSTITSKVAQANYVQSSMQQRSHRPEL